MLVKLIQRFSLCFAVLLCVLTVHAQDTFSITSQALALPGNKTTIAADITGITMAITPNFELRNDNIISGANFGGYFGGFNYYLPVLGKKLNNISPNLNGNRFRFHITASIGVDRLVADSIPVNHYAFLGGGGLEYTMSTSGRWSFAVEVRYAKLPGLANNTALVSVGPSLHF